MNEQKQQMQQLRVLWASFVGAILMYIFIGFQFLVSENKPISFNFEELSNFLFVALFLLGLSAALASHFFIPGILKGKNYKELLIIQIAFSEAAGIFGIVLLFLNESFTQLLVLCLVSLISVIRLFPQENNFYL